MSGAVLRRLAVGAALFAAAVAWFLLSLPLGLELTDTGLLVMPSWRVAAGAVPYLDFQHLYGPASFHLNAQILGWFGDDLLVLRAALVVRKALVALLVYACARQVASPPAALLVWALAVAVWGAPWWVFTTPYPNHDALGLVLLGLWCAAAGGGVGRAALAGLCVGVAAMFKQTSGLFGLMTMAVWLVGASGTVPPGGMPRLLRAAVLAGTVVLAAAYLSPRQDGWTLAMLAGPLAVLVAVRAAQARRGSGVAADAPLRLCAAAAGAAAPGLAWATWYAAHGLLGALVYNLAQMPRLVNWFVPFPPPGVEVLALAAALALIVVAAHRSGATAAGLGAAALAAVAVALLAAQRAGTPLDVSGWHGPLFRTVLLLPVAVAWAALPWALGDGPRPRRLYGAAAVVSLLLLYPAADVWHVAMALPMFLPALAARLDVAGVGRRAAVALVVGVLAAPFVHALWLARTAPAVALDLTRAPGLRAAPGSEAVAAVVAHLRGRGDGEGRLFVLCNESLLYYLADRPSAYEPGEYVLYLIGWGLLAPETARALLPEGELIAQLARLRPPLVDRPDGPASGHLRATYPGLAAFVDAHYRPALEAGPYRVLEWAG